MAKRRKKTETAIVWKNGFAQASVAEPEVVHAVLEDIKQSNEGNLLPDDVVEAAKPAASPLHGFFEWDNRKAGEAYRRDQARGLVRAIHVVRLDNPEKGSRRQYEVLPGAYGRGEPRPYRTVDEMMEDPDTRVALLDRALRELVAFQHKFRALQELAVVFRAIEEALETVER